MVDVIYVAASTLDARFTRICIASIRSVYPDTPIKLLVGGRLQAGLSAELQQYWNVELAPFDRRVFGWGFIKLEPLFGRAGERFLLVDSDTVITGDVLSLWDSTTADFMVDNEEYPAADIPARYFDWKLISAVDPYAAPPSFVFNSGQWFGTAGVLRREDFSEWVVWSYPRRLRHPALFFPGEQGVLNYVMNAAVREGRARIARRNLMYWPGKIRRDVEQPSLDNPGKTATIIHWAGLKKLQLTNMPMAEWLVMFEDLYYSRIPFPTRRRILWNAHDIASHVHAAIKVRLRLRLEIVASLFRKARRDPDTDTA